MDELTKKIERWFGSDHPPTRHELVILDGLDELDKAEALKHFGGKSWETIYQHLVNQEAGWTSVRLEEWACLEPRPLLYFLRPYLMYLLHTLKQKQPDDAFVSYLYFQLSEVLRIRGRQIFDEHQNELLTEIAGAVTATVMSDPRFDIWRNDIGENVKKFLSLLRTA
jgi:hypothetical protein